MFQSKIMLEVFILKLKKMSSILIHSIFILLIFTGFSSTKLNFIIDKNVILINNKSYIKFGDNIDNLIKVIGKSDETEFNPSGESYWFEKYYLFVNCNQENKIYGLNFFFNDIAELCINIDDLSFSKKNKYDELNQLLKSNNIKFNFDQKTREIFIDDYNNKKIIICLNKQFSEIIRIGVFSTEY